MSKSSRLNPRSQSDDIEARRREFLAAVKDRAKTAMNPALRSDAEEADLAEAVSKIHTMATQNMAMIERNAEARRRRGENLPQVACKKGCDYCCHLRVYASIPEVLNISQFVNSKFSQAEIIALKSRVEHHADSLAGLDPKEAFNKMLPCPLLVDHACSIHAVRPLRCRSHHSLDVDACRRGLVDPDIVKIPHFLEVDTVVAPLDDGIRASIKGQNLKSPTVTLAEALYVALSQHNACSRWIAGEDVFSAPGAKDRHPA